MKSQTTIMAYVGANPAGRPPPDLSTVPVSTDSNFLFIFALSFARDLNRDGNFVPVWDSSITPDLIKQLKAANPNRGFVASLGGGDNWPWQAPSDEAAWIKNAVNSLWGLANTYHLDAWDINYEQGLDDSFVRCMSGIMQTMNDYPTWPPRFQCNFTVTPYGGIYDVYQRLFVNNSTYIHTFNYQIYADGITDVQGYLNKYAQLAQANPDRENNGFVEIGLGMCSSTSSPRGLQAPGIFTVWDSLHSQGAANVFIWCLEDSAENGFYLESQIQARS